MTTELPVILDDDLPEDFDPDTVGDDCCNEENGDRDE